MITVCSSWTWSRVIATCYPDLTEVHISSIGLRTNEIMRVLTVISSVFIPLTFIAGVYGMNFAHMPELAQTWGYPASAFWSCSMVAIGQILYFKKTPLALGTFASARAPALA